MEPESRRGVHDIIGRLRRDAERRMQEPYTPRWARPVGILVAVAIVTLIVVMVVTANPL